MNQDRSSSPSGHSNRGMKRPSPSVKVTSHRSAISRVLSHASGRSRQTSRICAGLLR